MTNSLLPPGATPLERALEQATARIGDVGLPVAELWSPATCPAPLLPWLAWALSVDGWDPAWREPQKRAAVATSIALHRIKGTRASVAAVLARFDGLLQLVEWHEASPRQRPHTFDVVIPVTDADPHRTSAAFASALAREVTRVKPVREHMRIVQQLTLDAALAIVGAVRLVALGRADTAADFDTDPAWGTRLQTEQGEPIVPPEGGWLEHDA